MTLDLSESKKIYTIKLRLTWHELLILIIYEVIILIVIILVVRLVKHVYRLCNCNNLHMPDRYVKQNCCQIKTLGKKSDVFLEISSITNVIYIRIREKTVSFRPDKASVEDLVKACYKPAIIFCFIENPDLRYLHDTKQNVKHP